MNRLSTALIAGSFATIATAQAPRVRDSSGVRIADNGPRLTAPVVFQLGERPTFDVGGLQQDPADELNSRNYYLKGARLSGGRIVIIDGTRAHFYDASGKRLKTVGREGSGPGEFRQATDVCVVRGDTVLIGQTRGLINRFTGTGEFVDAVPPLAGAYPEGQFCFGDGTFTTLNRQRDFDPALGTPYKVTRSSFSRQLNTVADFTYPKFDMLISAEVGQATWGNRFYVAEPGTFDILGYNADGKLALIIRTADPLVAITDAERQKMTLSAYRAGATPAQIEADRKAAIAKSTTKYWPTHGHLVVDGSGRIWVEEWNQHFDPTQPVAWAAFDSTGRLLGRLVIPGAPSRELRREVMGFGTNEVFFKRYDTDGAPHLTIIPIVAMKR
jgi:hypothetical protein